MEISMTHETFSLLGCAEIEKWLCHENASRSSKNDKKEQTLHDDHDDDNTSAPLLNSIVLEKVFLNLINGIRFSEPNQYLCHNESAKRDLVSLRSLRLVCSTWNAELVRTSSSQFNCRSAKDVTDLLEMVTSKNAATPFLRNLSLKYNEVWRTPETFTLLWNVQDNLKVLEIAATELEFCPLMVLPKLCPGLQKLRFTCMDVFPDVKWKELELNPFVDIWINPFPNLREVTMCHGSLTKAAVKLIIVILKKCKGVTILDVQTDTGFGRDNGIQDFGEQLMLNPEIFERLKRFTLENEDCSGFMKGITTIAPQVGPRHYANLHTFALIQKSGAQYPPISTPSMEKALSKMVQDMSPTLKSLTIVNSCETLDNNASVSKLVIPEVMPSLEFICLGNIGFNLEFKKGKVPSGQWGFSKIFPKLTHFEFWVRIFNDISDIDKSTMFEILFPPLRNTRGDGDDVRNAEVRRMSPNLKNFHIYTRIHESHEHILEELTFNFPALQSLMLELDGELLSRAISVLKTLKIEHFTLIYYETRNGTHEFDAAVTGVEMSVCRSLILESEDNRDFLDIETLAEHKTADSFTDWPCLTRLNVSYRHGGVFDVVFFTFCLRAMKTLKHLELRHFDINENLLIRMIKKLDLTSLVLGNCRVISRDEDYPVMNHNFGIDDLVAKYKKNVKVSFVGYEGAADYDSVPYYAQLLHHFDYDYHGMAE